MTIVQRISLAVGEELLCLEFETVSKLRYYSSLVSPSWCQIFVSISCACLSESADEAIGILLLQIL
jgi:hypothetical protein